MEEDYEPDSPIPEVEEDIPTDESGIMEDSPKRNINLKKPTMKPDDTIVLEFGCGLSQNKSKINKHFMSSLYIHLAEP